MVHLIRRRSDKSYFALKRVPIDKDATDEKRAINNEVSLIKMLYKSLNFVSNLCLFFLK